MRYVDRYGQVWEVPTEMLINEEGRLATFDEVESFFGPLHPLDSEEER